MFASGEHLISRRRREYIFSCARKEFLVWQKGDLGVTAIRRPQQHGHYACTANILGTNTGKQFFVCGGIGYGDYQPTKQIFLLLHVGFYFVAYVRQVEQYSFYWREWKALRSMTKAREDAASVVVEANSLLTRHVMVLGGSEYRLSRWCMNEVEMYSLELNKWSRVTPMPNQKKKFTTTIFKDNVVSGPQQYGSKVSSYDMFLDKWLALPDLPSRHVPHGDLVKFTTVTNAFCRDRNYYGYHVMVMCLPGIYWLDDNTNEWHFKNMDVEIGEEGYRIKSFFLHV